jgi:Na+-translocating ferredoxin:NAD+ oxidoreductase RnfD subunit
MVVVRKVSPEQWAYEINRSIQLRMTQKTKARQLKFRYYDKFISQIMPLPVIIGLTAIILIVYFYGWRDLGKLALSWLVSVTIISTFVYHMFKRFEAELG